MGTTTPTLVVKIGTNVWESVKTYCDYCFSWSKKNKNKTRFCFIFLIQIRVWMEGLGRADRIESSHGNLKKHALVKWQTGMTDFWYLTSINNRTVTNDILIENDLWKSFHVWWVTHYRVKIEGKKFRVTHEKIFRIFFVHFLKICSEALEKKLAQTAKNIRQWIFFSFS